MRDEKGALKKYRVDQFNKEGWRGGSLEGAWRGRSAACLVVSAWLAGSLAGSLAAWPACWLAGKEGSGCEHDEPSNVAL